MPGMTTEEFIGRQPQRQLIWVPSDFMRIVETSSGQRSNHELITVEYL